MAEGGKKRRREEVVQGIEIGGVRKKKKKGVPCPIRINNPSGLKTGSNIQGKKIGGVKEKRSKRGSTMPNLDQ